MHQPKQIPTRYLLLLVVCIFSSNLFCQNGLGKTAIEAYYESNDILKTNKEYADWIFGEVYQFDPVGHIARGIEKYESGYYEEAKKDFDASIDLEPDCAFCYFARAKNNMALEEEERAKEDLYEAVYLDSSLVDAYHELGLIYWSQEEIDSARHYMNYLIERHPDYPLAYYNLGGIEWQKDRRNKALKLYQQAIAKDSCFTEAYTSLSFLYMQRGNLNQAINTFDKISNCGADTSSLFYLAKAAMNLSRNRLDPALEELNQAILLDPENAPYRELRGLIYYEQRQFDKALDDIVLFNQLQFKKLQEEPRLYTANTRNTVEAISYYGDRRNSISEDVRKFIDRGIYHLDYGQLSTAEFNFKKALNKAKEDCINCQIFMGITQQRMGNFKIALSHYDQVIQLDPNFYEVYDRRANLKVKLQDYEGATADYSYIIKNDTNYLSAIQDRGNLSLLQGKYRMALIDFNSYLEKDSMEIDALFNRAICFETIKLYDNAIADLTKIIQQRDYDLEVIYRRALCHYYNKNNEKALEDCQTAIDIYGNYAEAFNLMGAIHLESGEYDEAIQDLDEAISKKAKYTDALVNRFRAYYLKENYQKAIADLDLLIQYQPTEGQYFLHRAEVKNKLKDFSACNDLHTAIALGIVLSEEQKLAICPN